MQSRNRTEPDFSKATKKFTRALRRLDDELRASGHHDSYARHSLRSIVNQTNLICQTAATLWPPQAAWEMKMKTRECA